jgi:hypothetical protein
VFGLGGGEDEQMGGVTAVGQEEIPGNELERELRYGRN